MSSFEESCQLMLGSLLAEPRIRVLDARRVLIDIPPSSWWIEIPFIWFASFVTFAVAAGEIQLLLGAGLILATMAWRMSLGWTRVLRLFGVLVVLGSLLIAFFMEPGAWEVEHADFWRVGFVVSTLVMAVGILLPTMRVIALDLDGPAIFSDDGLAVNGDIQVLTERIGYCRYQVSAVSTSGRLILCATRRPPVRFTSELEKMLGTA